MLNKVLTSWKTWVVIGVVEVAVGIAAIFLHKGALQVYSSIGFGLAFVLMAFYQRGREV